MLLINAFLTYPSGARAATEARPLRPPPSPQLCLDALPQAPPRLGPAPGGREEAQGAFCRDLGLNWKRPCSWGVVGNGCILPTVRIALCGPLGTPSALRIIPDCRDSGGLCVGCCGSPVMWPQRHTNILAVIKIIISLYMQPCPSFTMVLLDSKVSKLFLYICFVCMIQCRKGTSDARWMIICWVHKRDLPVMT